MSLQRRVYPVSYTHLDVYKRQVEKKVEATDTEEKAPLNNGGKDLDLNEYDLDTLREAKKNGFNGLHIHVKLDEKTILKSARVFILFQTLESKGEIIKSTPNLEDLESENFDFDIDLIFVTEVSRDEVLHNIEAISEIREVLVEEISSSVVKTVASKAVEETAATVTSENTSETPKVEAKVAAVSYTHLI